MLKLLNDPLQSLQIKLKRNSNALSGISGTFSDMTGTLNSSGIYTLIGTREVINGKTKLITDQHKAERIY